jgi:hypothetical protein
MINMFGSADTRYSFTGQFLQGAAIFARRAHDIEKSSPIPVELYTDHRAYVAGAIMQSAAALESEIAEVIEHGPGHHLGSGHIDQSARDFLTPMVDVLDRQEPLRKYELTLHLLKKPALDRGSLYYDHAKLLVQLRNELIHYKSKWGAQMQGLVLMSRLEKLNFPAPPFISLDMNFFPHRCLSASLASWTVITSNNFLTEFYKLLGFNSPIISYNVSVPPPTLKP